MVPRRLPDMSSLWTNPENRFILRFHDLEDRLKHTLALRIKECSPVYSVREKEEPDILNALMEINPIIFSEYTGSYANRYRTRRDHHSCFAFGDTRVAVGWAFKNLCRGIYKTICLKKQLSEHELIHIANLTANTWDDATRYARQSINVVNPSSGEQPLPHGEVGIAEIEQARLRAEQEIARTRPRPRDQGVTYNQLWQQAQEELRRESTVTVRAANFAEMPHNYYTTIVVDDAGNNITT